MDIVPTLLDLANLTHPTHYKSKPVLPLQGKSWKSFLVSPSPKDTFAIHSPTEATGFEISGSGALRKGRYKITYVSAPHGPQMWELFDILDDPGETRDLSGESPEVFGEMVEAWEKYKKDVGVVGLRGELQSVDAGNRDLFEDDGRWIRWVGKEDAPEEVARRFAAAKA